MSYKTRWNNGSWRAVCDVCGRDYKNTDLEKRWDGLMVCQGDWETRQPQDFVKGVADKQVPPFTRPEQSDVFICNINDSQGLADYGTANCAQADSNYFLLLETEDFLPQEFLLQEDNSKIFLN